MKEKQKKIQKQNGITLIALVVTIVVLLILAGTSIAMLSGDNGIVTNAEGAKLQTNHNSVVDGVKLKIGEYQIARNVDGYTKDFITFLKENENGAIIDDNGVINIKNLLGEQLSTGNGIDQKNVYVLEEMVESETNNTVKYMLKYYNTSANEIQLETFGGIATTITNGECEYCNATGEVIVCADCKEITSFTTVGTEEVEICTICGDGYYDDRYGDPSFACNCSGGSLESATVTIWRCDKCLQEHYYKNETTIACKYCDYCQYCEGYTGIIEVCGVCNNSIYYRDGNIVCDWCETVYSPEEANTNTVICLECSNCENCDSKGIVEMCAACGIEYPTISYTDEIKGEIYCKTCDNYGGSCCSDAPNPDDCKWYCEDCNAMFDSEARSVRTKDCVDCIKLTNGEKED